MEFVLLMGFILLVMAIVLPFKLQWKIEVPTCLQEIRDVKTNKIAYTIIVVICVLCFVSYLIFR